MVNTQSDLAFVDRYYNARCNGHWEHYYGFSIETCDNPGWMLTLTEPLPTDLIDLDDLRDVAERLRAIHDVAIICDVVDSKVEEQVQCMEINIFGSSLTVVLLSLRELLEYNEYSRIGHA